MNEIWTSDFHNNLPVPRTMLPYPIARRRRLARGCCGRVTISALSMMKV
jgi:hypothetical protein